MSANCWRTSSSGRLIEPDDVTRLTGMLGQTHRRRQSTAGPGPPRFYSRIAAVAAPQGIDVHAHFFPERFLRRSRTAARLSGGSIDRSSPAGPAIDVKGQRTPPLEARYYDLAKRVASMNRQGVAVQALSLTAPMVYWAQAELGRRLARRVERRRQPGAHRLSRSLRGLRHAADAGHDAGAGRAGPGREAARRARRLHGHQRQRARPVRPRVLPGVRALRRSSGCRWGSTRSTSTARSGSSPTT